MKNKLLLVEDDVNFSFVLKSYLEMNDFDVDIVSDGSKAIPTLTTETYDLCIFDVMLPNVDGFTIAKEFRKFNQTTPIIFLTAKSLKEDMLEGFKSGADDYINKPFDPDLLLAKVRAIIRRNSPSEQKAEVEKIKIGKYDFNIKLRTLTTKTESHRLTPREANLLLELIKNKNNVLDRDEALRKIWGDDNYFNARSMDVYITKLRKYFKDDEQININNVHGTGFVLTMPD